jgi:hypothetical protein
MRTPLRDHPLMRRGPISNWPPLWMLANVGPFGRSYYPGDRTITESDESEQSKKKSSGRKRKWGPSASAVAFFCFLLRTVGTEKSRDPLFDLRFARAGVLLTGLFSQQLIHAPV